MYKMPRLALFDLDGTLVHLEHDYFYVEYERLYQELGREVPTRAEFDVMAATHSLFSDIPEEERKEFECAFWSRYDDVLPPTAREITGSLETLDYFYSSGCMVAIVTARTQLPEEVEHTIDHLGLNKHIHVISTLGEPHLQTYNMTPTLKCKQIDDVCRRLDVGPEQCLIAGDSPTDITSGKAAGVGVTVALLSGGVARDVLERTSPDLLLETVVDMPGLFV